jgi:opacity protein-like surface antigen
MRRVVMLKGVRATVLAAILMSPGAAALAADPAIVIISHPVADFAAWKKRFDAGKEMREKAGLTQRYVMRDADKPNVVIVVFEASVENARKFVSEPGFQERVKKASSSGSAEIKIAIQ